MDPYQASVRGTMSGSRKPATEQTLRLAFLFACSLSLCGCVASLPEARLRADSGEAEPVIRSFEDRFDRVDHIIAPVMINGRGPFRFMIVGHGVQQDWLREKLHSAEFTGVLRGEALSEAYANMDLFVFPSHTDTFGNVVLEAFASGVPAIVTPEGGPKSIVREGATGRIVADKEFAAAVAGVLRDPVKHAAMRKAARTYALTMSWDAVFEGVYAAYETILPVRTAG